MENNTSIIVRQVPEEISNIRQFYEYESIAIASEDDLRNAGTKLASVKDRLKKAKTFRDAIIKPIRDAMKKQDEVFQEVIKPLEKIEIILKSKITKYMDMVQAELDAAKKKLLAEQKKELESKAFDQKVEAVETGSNTALESANKFQERADKIDTENVFQRQTMKIDGSTIAQKKVWKWKVVDQSQVPNGLMMVDAKAVNQLMRELLAAGAQEIKVPGLEFYQESSISVNV